MGLPPAPPQRAASGREQKKPGGFSALSYNYLLSHQTETGGNPWRPATADFELRFQGGPGLRKLRQAS